LKKDNSVLKMKENRLFYRYLYILFVFGILVSVKGLSVERKVV